MSIQDLIKKYTRKIQECADEISKINSLINPESSNSEDLEYEKENCIASRNIYVKFVRDLRKIETLS